MFKKSKIGKGQFSADRYLEHAEEAVSWMKRHGSLSTKEINDLKIAYIRHRGSFDSVESCFERLAQWADTYLSERENSKWILIVHDNPDITDETKLMQSAGLIVNGDYPSTDRVNFLKIPSGRFLVGQLEIEDNDFTHAWACMSSILLAGDYVLRDGYFFETFRGDSLFSPGQKHVVEIHLPIE